MLITAGHTEVDPDDRDESVAVMRDPLTRACDAPGCLDQAPLVGHSHSTDVLEGATAG
jgi:hypothetical protein